MLTYKTDATVDYINKYCGLYIDYLNCLLYGWVSTCHLLLAKLALSIYWKFPPSASNAAVAACLLEKPTFSNAECKSNFLN